VNAWTAGRRGAALSLEHALLPLTGARGYRPEPWTPVDSLAWLKAMAWDLRSNMESELERGRLLAVDLGPGRAWQDLFPAYDAVRHPTVLPWGGGVVDGAFVPAAGTAVDRTEVPAATRVAAGRADEAVAHAAALVAEDALMTSPKRIRMLPASEVGTDVMVFIHANVDAFGGAQRLSFRVESVVGDERVSVWIEKGGLDINGDFVPHGAVMSFTLPVVLWEYLRQFTVTSSGGFELQRPWMASFTAINQAWERAYPYLRARPDNNSVTSGSVSSRKNVGERYY
jgi:hypothetical protein